MKLLFDENISSKLIKFLLDDFPESSHIDYLRMQGTTDGHLEKFKVSLQNKKAPLCPCA